jgi:hypothetical protein
LFRCARSPALSTPPQRRQATPVAKVISRAIAARE